MKLIITYKAEKPGSFRLGLVGVDARAYERAGVPTRFTIEDKIAERWRLRLLTGIDFPNLSLHDEDAFDVPVDEYEFVSSYFGNEAYTLITSTSEEKEAHRADAVSLSL